MDTKIKGKTCLGKYASDRYLSSLQADNINWNLFSPNSS